MTPTTATITIKAAYSVRNVSISNEGDITTVMAINIKTKGSFYKDENWWKNQINLACQALFTKIPYVSAKKAKVCDLKAPQVYYYFNGQTQAQELQQVHFPIDDNKLTILPTPTRSKEGIYRIKISFEASFGPDASFLNKLDDYALFEKHLQIIRPAALLLAQTYWQLPDLNLSDNNIRRRSMEVMSNFRENCKKAFMDVPLETLQEDPTLKRSYTAPPTPSPDVSIENTNSNVEEMDTEVKTPETDIKPEQSPSTQPATSEKIPEPKLESSTPTRSPESKTKISPKVIGKEENTLEKKKKKKKKKSSNASSSSSSSSSSESSSSWSES